MPKAGRDFELAVWGFVKTLDSAAEVIFDHKVPDRDTGEPRQCDVWVNALFGGHWSLSILISCKDHKRKLHQGDIGNFHDEIRSTGASMGIIYSKNGFTVPALKKAKALGRISCCRMYQNASADIPPSVWIDAVACQPRIQLSLVQAPLDSDIKTWMDVLDMRTSKSTVQDMITENFHEQETMAIDQAKQTGGYPIDWAFELRLGHAIETEHDLVLRIYGAWLFFRGKTEAILVNGSYSILDDSFHGSIRSPIVDVKGEHPGPDWEIIDRQLLPTVANRMVWMRYHGDIGSALRDKLGPTRVYPSTEG